MRQFPMALISATPSSQGYTFFGIFCNLDKIMGKFVRLSFGGLKIIVYLCRKN